MSNESYWGVIRDTNSARFGKAHMWSIYRHDDSRLVSLCRMVKVSAGVGRVTLVRRRCAVCEDILRKMVKAADGQG